MREALTIENLNAQAIRTLRPGNPLFDHHVAYRDEDGRLWFPGKSVYAVSGDGNSLLEQYPLAQMGPVRVAFIGASITNGSSADNAGAAGYAPLVGKTADSRKIDQKALYFGYPGTPATYIAQQIETVLAAKPDIVIAGCDFGTNQSASSATEAGLIANFITPLLAVEAACRAAGVAFAASMTLSHAIGGVDADTYTGMRRQNIWLATMAPKLGIDVIDTYSPLLDHSTGWLDSAYVTGAEIVHPNNAGHAAIAAVYVAWLEAKYPAMLWPAGRGNSGLVANPLMTGAGTTPDSYTTTVSPSTFAGVRTNSLVSRVDATDLPAGRWYRVQCDASAGGHGVLRTGTATIAVTPGEELLIFGYVKAEGAGTVSAAIWNVSTTAAATGLATAANGGPSKPFFIRYPVPAGMLSMRVVLNITTTATQVATGYLGAVDVVRPASLGLT